MARIVIVYDSKTGNTEKMALEVAIGAEQVGGMEVIVKKAKQTTLLSILQAMLIHGMIVQGRADEKHYGAAAVGSPKKSALKYCEDLGRSTASLVKKLSSR